MIAKFLNELASMSCILTESMTKMKGTIFMDKYKQPLQDIFVFLFLKLQLQNVDANCVHQKSIVISNYEYSKSYRLNHTHQNIATHFSIRIQEKKIVLTLWRESME